LLDKQKAVGPYTYFSEQINSAHSRIQGLTNTT